MREPLVAGYPVALRLPQSRFRNPRDVIVLIGGGALLAALLISAAVAHGRLLGPDAPVPSLFRGGQAGETLVGLVQVAVCAGAAAVLIAAGRHRRLRLLAGLAVAGAAAAAATAAILALAGDTPPPALAANLARRSWLAGAAFPDPALAAAAVAVCVAVVPWLGRGWRRAAWVLVLGTGAARLLTGTALPMELAIAAAAGALAGLGVRVAAGVPDRRPGSDAIAAELRSAGLPVTLVSPADVQARGSRPFTAVTDDGSRLFVKAYGADQRHADLLYRAYRAVRLKRVGDARPAASLQQAVEHQALVAMMAQRAGVDVPAVHRVVRTAGQTMLLVMDEVDGSSLDLVPERQVGDDLLEQLWMAVRTLHGARLAHRSLRAANVMVDRSGRSWLVDFGFAELAAYQRQIDLDVAELLASTATLIGPDRAVAAAVRVLGAGSVAAAVPLLQPLALSAATRRATAGHQGLLARTRSAAAAQSGRPDEQLASVQRVRPRTLLAITAASAAFYILLPELAKAAGSWRAVLHADWVWLLAVLAASALTYVASALALAGSVPIRLRFWPTLTTQAASSFVNRISPANVAGMALNARFLQKSGVEPAAGVAAVGVNAFAGAVVHLALMAIFFALAGRRLAGAFHLPSGSKLLLILAAVAAVVGLVLATRPGRRFTARKILPALRSSLANLRQVARRPVKISLLMGGSALVTLAYIGGLAAAVQAFAGHFGLAEIGVVYLVASTLAAASPTPGGVGAIETALIAGLTGIGVRSGAAVPAVITYRLATYWLPVLPGWAAFQMLQRRNLI
jgi:glycosyltransferase 2 family protein